MGFQIGTFEIRFYGIIVMLGVLAAAFLADGLVARWRNGIADALKQKERTLEDVKKEVLLGLPYFVYFGGRLAA